MRVVISIALCSAALAAQCAFADDKPAPAPAPPPSQNVTVNFGALPTPTPHRKPSPNQMQTHLVPIPRAKPSPESLVALVPMPRPKPQIEVAAAPAKIKPPPQIGTEAAPAHETALASPQSAADTAAALRGAAMSTPPATPVNPLVGFSLLTRVRFSGGKSDLGDDAKATLDTLAARLLGNEERVRLAAFSGRSGDLSSQSHRLSLARALSVRTYLVSKGVPISRVDVLALGASTDGTSDRVDVLVRSATRRTG